MHRSHPIPVNRCLLILTLFLTVTGCSLKVTYPFMDWWLSWTVRDYISLDRPQRKELETNLDRFHHWHQHTQLPEYASFVEQLSDELEQPMSTEKLTSITTQINEHWQNSLDYLLPDIDDLFLSLDDNQWQGFLQKLTENQAEYSEPFLKASPEERLTLRQKRFEKGAKRWIGRITDEQQKMIKEWSTQLQGMAELNLQRQESWNLEATRIFSMRQQTSKEQRQILLRELINNDSPAWTPEAQEKIAQNQQATYNLLLKLHASLSSKQHKKLQSELKSYRADFHNLAGKTDTLALTN